ncbi:DUF4238 domain-containing protein [Sphingobacterium siyangense]|uniref:DUF4238 domain-containing protein n=1 Tax=Sphingobacterium siyangense TaxID=459529 RepID=UPI003C757206
MNNEVLEFQKFRKRMAVLLEKILNVGYEGHDIKSPSSEISKKHHYIPKYFINAFTDANKQLFIYDKEKDIIRKNKNTSAGLFFEMHRNSLHLGGEDYLPIFEEFYCFSDNNFPYVLKLLWSDNPDLPQDEREHLMAHINIFILDLFLRNKNNDRFFDELFERSEIEFENQELNEQSDLIREYPGIKQLFRAKLLNVYINEFLNSDLGKFTRMRLIKFPDEQICIGDNPMLFLNISGTPEALFNSPLILPISNRKLYLRNVERQRPFSYLDALLFNALVIDQSSKIIACSSHKTLEDSIKTYHYIKKEDMCDSTLIGLFFDDDFDIKK